MNLVLIGYRGTGKSTVAGYLAEALARPVLGMDDEIVRRAGSTIPAFVAAHGWSAFRDLETAVARDFAARDAVIIDCGGGVIERPENIDQLKAQGVIFWLAAGIDHIVARIAGATDRPALTAGKSFIDEIGEVLAARTPRYAAAADHRVDIDGRESRAVADEILVRWRSLAR